MQDHQRNHILASYHAAMKYLAEVRQVVATGTSADGTRYAPFPEPLSDKLLEAVDRLIASLEELKRAVIPGGEDLTEKVKGVGTARMWISTLLLLTQEQLDDIDPERMGRQYGVLPNKDATQLQEGVERLQATIDNIMTLLK